MTTMIVMTRPVPKKINATATAPEPETAEVKVPAPEEAPRNRCGS